MYEGGEFQRREELSAESVTIGSGVAAMLRIESASLDDLQAVINVGDDGDVRILDVVGKEDGTKVYEIWGPLFFGAVHNFNSKFDVRNDPDKVEIDFIESTVSDHSGIEAINNLVGKYLDLGKSIRLKHLSPECKMLLLKSNADLSEIIESAIDYPRYHVVTDIMDSEV